MNWFTPATGDVRTRGKVVIVGAGAGGAFAAVTLAEAGLDVVVLEDGHHYRHKPLTVGEATAKYFAERAFRTSSGRPPLPVVGGRALGGSTVVNSALCFRTPPERLDEWNEATGHLLPADRWWPIQDAVERVMHVAETPDRLLSGNDLVHREAARALGWKEGNLRRNTPYCVGCGRCNQGCTVQGKYSVDIELLPRAAAAGARVFAGCKVTRVGEGRVEGFVADADGQRVGEIAVDADAVVLCAGAVSTPTLLLDSGLAEAGGPVGFGLRVQPVISAIGYFPDRVVFTPGSTQGHYIDEFADDDILFEANPILASMLGALPFWGEEAHQMLAHGAHWASTGTLVRDRTDGRVMRSTSGGAADIRYDLVEEDHQRLIRALRVGARLWFEGLGAERVVLGTFGRALVRNMAEVDARLADLPADQLLLYSSHPQASCRLGSALEETGRVRGTSSVYCADASALPSNVGRNPQISVMTMARLLSERIAHAHGGSVQPLD